jgi:hypothetical protein
MTTPPLKAPLTPEAEAALLAAFAAIPFEIEPATYLKVAEEEAA